MSVTPAKSFWKRRQDSTEFLIARFASSQPGRCECVKTGRANSSGITPGNHVDPPVDADGSTEGNHFLWNVPEYAMPRVLPSSGFSAVQISRFMAYSRLLRASRRAVSPCERYRAEATLLGASCRRALEDRLAAYQSGRVIGSDVRAEFSN